MAANEPRHARCKNEDLMKTLDFIVARINLLSGSGSGVVLGVSSATLERTNDDNVGAVQRNHRHAHI